MSDLGQVPSTADRKLGIRVLRLRLRGVQKSYDVDFRSGTGARPLSVIAGPVSTGKTTILEFIAYLLGGNEHPEHQEVLAQVISAQLEVELAGVVHVIERTVGRPSTTANVFVSTMDDVAAGVAAGTRRPIQPPGSPDSLSAYLLSQVSLEGVKLREAPTQAESEADPLSIRDVMWLCFLPNERLDDKNLLFESAYMKALKLRQVIDVVFGVHDNRLADLADRISQGERELGKKRADLTSARQFVEEQESRNEGQLDVEAEIIRSSMEETDDILSGLRNQIEGATNFASDLRERHRAAAATARRLAGLLRDRETLLIRLAPLRAQYSEDIRKLTMLVQAHDLFDPLRVVSCPACLSTLTASPTVLDHQCSLCGTVLAADDQLDLGAASSSAIPSATDIPVAGNAPSEMPVAVTNSELIAAHLRSTRARLKELNGYVDGLEEERSNFRGQLANATRRESEAAAALDRATVEAISPFLARRDELNRARQAGAARLDDVERGLRLHAGLRGRETLVGRLDANLTALREQRNLITDQASDRREAVAAVSARFGEILADFQYPKLERPYIDDRWVPHVRDLSYQQASSGARTLLSIAWCLAIFETAVERRLFHPGFLMLDSPQKNIGIGTDSDDDFVDAAVVDGVYRHLRNWLAGEGQGCQVIVVDNDPPAATKSDVIVRFTRDAIHPPYGLIDNETSVIENTGP